MTWWMVLLGVVFLVPALVVVVGLYIGWFNLGRDVLDDDLRRGMPSDEECLGVMFWVVHFLVLTMTGGILLANGLGA